MKWFAFFISVLTLAAGCVLEDKPVIPEDGGVEAGPCGICPLDTPVCSVDDLQCVECTSENEAYCTGQMLVCNTGTFKCVQCTANSECDDPTDCAVLYPDGSLPICCSSLKQRRAWCAEECPIIKADQNPNCLSTWNCPEDQVCVSLPFLAETYNCVMEDDQSFQ